MKYSELEKILTQAGCYRVKEGANHPIWFSPITQRNFVTGRHQSKEVAIGTLRGISKQSGVKL